VFANTTRVSGPRPGHGHTAVFAPDGSRLGYAGDDPDRLVTATLDLSMAIGEAAAERREHPLFRRFWEVGVTLMNGGRMEVPADALEHAPLASPEVELKVAAAQMACSRSLQENVARATALVREATGEHADVVVFPELALTGALDENVGAADERSLRAALMQIQSAARDAAICVVMGMPWLEGGERFNCAVAIGPDGEVLTRYAQLAVDRPDLFAPGRSTRAMWCAIKGVPTVLTVGWDALWSELAELAAVRGAQAHLHLSYDRDVSPGASRRRRQLWTNLANYRTLTVLVNAAAPSHLARPSAPAQGGSAIWEDFRREPHLTARRSGHGPWSAYRLAEAAEGEELLCARQTVLPVNAHYAQMTGTINPQMKAWYALGARAICAELDDMAEQDERRAVPAVPAVPVGANA